MNKRDKCAPLLKVLAKIFGSAVLLLSLPTAASSEQCSNEAKRQNIAIGSGSFAPLYGLAPGQTAFFVKSFAIDKYPVMNCEFQEFVRNNPAYGKGTMSALLADEQYLNTWSGEGAFSTPPQGAEKLPVVRVSWFAATAFCRARGGTLPTVLQWEYVAAASERKKNASRDPAFIDKILAWYSRPSGDGAFSEVGKGVPNAWGVHDLHGLVWEWTYDFNSVFVAGDSRRDGDSLKNMFCGSAALSSADKANYAAYIRYALRNSLKAGYTTGNLGFRCAYSGSKRSK